MKNSFGNEITPQRDEFATFTQLSGKHLKCNACGVKVTRNGVEGHRNSHKPGPKRVETQTIKTQCKVSNIMNTSNR